MLGGCSAIKLFYNEKTAAEETTGPALPVHLKEREQERSGSLWLPWEAQASHSAARLLLDNTSSAGLESRPSPAGVTKAT